jgi:hypothetical protein
MTCMSETVSFVEVMFVQWCTSMKYGATVTVHSTRSSCRSMKPEAACVTCVLVYNVLLIVECI